MKKFVKILALVMALVMTAALSVGLTLAYLTDQEEAVNVMTLGNVSIKQHELQRKDGVDYKNGGQIADGDELEAFEQGQLLFPSTYTDISDYSAKSSNEEQFWWGPYVTADVSGNGSSNGLWDDKLTGAMDKFVFVENTGKSDAYYRTVIAFECPEGMEYGDNSDKEFMMNANLNGRFDREEVGYVTINGSRFLVLVMTYNKVLEPGTISRPSLLQVVMTHHATNEDMELLGDSYEILVVSQAVQVEGFADAQTALNTAFGEITTTNHPWINGVPALGWDGTADTSWYNADETEFVITTADELAGLAEMVNAGNNFKGKTVKLAANINLGNKAWTPIGQNGDKAGFQGTFDGQGHTISNLNVDLSERAYQAAGLFGSARYATIKNFKVVNATIKNLDDAGNTSNGAAVVVGAAQFTTTIDNVDVENATVIGNRRVSAIAGYFVGTITNCDVNNVELVANFDDLGNGSYDNCDKVGGIIAYSNGASTITNNTVKNARISGYRDIGGIAGYATSSTLTGNKVENVDFTILKSHDYKNYATAAEHDVNAIIGEGTADDTNTATNVNIRMFVYDWYDVIYTTSVDGKTAYISSNGGNETSRGIFENNADIESVVFAEGIEVIGNRTMRRCYGLTSVTLPSTLTEIGAGAFQSCGKLETISIPASVQTIGANAFEATSLKEITIPDGVTRIETSALRETALVEIELPASVTYIGSTAFRDCKSLEKVVISADSVEVEKNAFYIVSGVEPTTVIYVKNAEMKSYLETLFAGDSSLDHITVQILP